MKEYFEGVKEIKYEGDKSTNPLAFKYYDSEKIVAGKPMKDHFRFAMSYWHTLTAMGSDVFGEGTAQRPWVGKEGMELAKARQKQDLNL